MGATIYYPNGTSVTAGTQTFAGAKTFSSPLRISDASGGTETPFGAGASDGGIGGFYVENGTSGAAAWSTSSRYIATTTLGNFLIAQAATDTGTTALMEFRSRIGSATAVSTRPIFKWSNHTTGVMQMSAAGGLAINGGTAPSLVIGGATPNANAILDLQSTTKPFMPPRMTTSERNAVASPTAGMVIYNSTTNKLNVYTTTWEAVTSV